MQWGSQQLGAIDAVGRWLRKKDKPCFCLFGYAGVGKTTLAIHLAETAGRVMFGAYTGKAASVMRDKGCFGAQTIHSLIYVPASKSHERLKSLMDRLAELIHELKSEPEYRVADAREAAAMIDQNTQVVRMRKLVNEEKKKAKQPAFTLNPDSELNHADLLIIDECSMIGERMGEDILSFGCPVLVLGDPAQLPPVKGCGYFTQREPDVMLTEIHRQAADSPVIALATRVRSGETLLPGQYGSSLVMRGRPDKELVTCADQILVGKNVTRRGCNQKMRKLLNRHSEDLLPVEGDTVVCLRNDHEVGLLNGTLWKTLAVETFGSDRLAMRVAANGETLDVEAHTHYFQGKENDLSHWDIREAQCFDFGYALTAHKAQGSQWDDVFIFDEGHVFKHNQAKWLYTAITRAAKKVTICQPG